jgi:hypothetical protein
MPFSRGLYYNALLSLENSNQPNMKPQSLFNADLACSAKLDEPLVITIRSQLSLYLLSLWFERSAITRSARAGNICQTALFLTAPDLVSDERLLLALPFNF